MSPSDGPDIAFKDHFSRHAELYRRYRPAWPPAVFTWLASLTPVHLRAWDVGTGSGQAAHGLARHFAEVTRPTRARPR